MKNKGQVLVAFLLFLPVLLLLLGMVFELGTLTLAKHDAELKVKQITKTALEEQQTIEQINQLLASNFSAFELEKIEQTTSLIIQIKIPIETAFTHLFHLKKHWIPIRYEASWVGEEIKLKKG